MNAFLGASVSASISVFANTCVGMFTVPDWFIFYMPFPVFRGGGLHELFCLHTVDMFFGQLSVNLPDEMSHKNRLKLKETL